MSTMTLYPVPGRLVRHPETGEPVPAFGVTVPRSTYWLRRLREGDLTACPASGRTTSATAGGASGSEPGTTKGGRVAASPSAHDAAQGVE